MCSIIIIDGRTIDCMRELTALVGREAIVRDSLYTEPLDYDAAYCLCPVDIQETGRRAGYIVTQDDDDPMEYRFQRPC